MVMQVNEGLVSRMLLNILTFITESTFHSVIGRDISTRYRAPRMEEKNSWDVPRITTE